MLTTSVCVFSVLGYVVPMEMYLLHWMHDNRQLSLYGMCVMLIKTILISSFFPNLQVLCYWVIMDYGMSMCLELLCCIPISSQT